jgi:outer membrane protein TolC
MDGARRILTWLLAGSMLLPSGCFWQSKNSFQSCAPAGAYEQVASEIEYPTESACTAMNADESLSSPHPWTIDTQGTPEYWDISIEEAIQLALANSKVMRDLGGAVVRAPATQRTTLDPAIAETDPRFGIEAALSEFDAQWLTSTFWERNDRAVNNVFFGGGTRELQQDVGVFQTAITKRAVTGSRFTIRHNVDYDANNAPGNRFFSAWNANVEAEIRHPFLQGSGVQFNRVAGLDSTPGVYDGVLIARLNADVALTDFEIAVRDLVSNVENAYWDLYFGYRVLDAKVKARDAALDTWRATHARYESGQVGGEAHNEAQAREQFFRFQQDTQNALSGEPYESTRNWNGQPSGSFRPTGGVLMAERRLRLLMGLPPSDVSASGACKLLRPTDEPLLAKINFDWCQVTEEASTRRAELRRQKWQIRRRELELMASKNYLLPRLDGVGRYRWRGFGDDLFPIGAVPKSPDEQFDGAYSNLTGGEFQEWQLGFELTVPIGFRQAHVAARNAELLLARERALLQDQQREVIHEAADAIAEMDRAYTVMQTSYNRLDATKDQLASVKAKYEEGKGDVPLDLYLESQRRVVEAETEFYLNRARYVLAAKNVHFVKGTLLDYDGIFLAEGPWPGEAYHDAAKREASRSQPRPLNYASSKAPVVSKGAFDQNLSDGEPMEAMEATATDPFKDDELPLNSPMDGSPMHGPTLDLNEEPLPAPAAEATDLPMSAAPGKGIPVRAVPNRGMHLSAASEIMQPQSVDPWAGVPVKSVDVVVADEDHAAGGVAPAIYQGPKPTPVEAPKTQSVPPTTRRLPPSISR